MVYVADSSTNMRTFLKTEELPPAEVLQISEAALHRCSYKKCSENMQQLYRRKPMPKLISIKLQSNFTEIKLWHACFPVYLLHMFRTRFSQNTSRRFLLQICFCQQLYWDIRQ